MSDAGASNVAGVHKHFDPILLLLLTVILILSIAGEGGTAKVYNTKMHSGEKNLERIQEKNTSHRKTNSVRKMSPGQDQHVHSKISTSKNNDKEVIVVKEQIGTEATLKCSIEKLPKHQNASLVWVRISKEGVTNLTTADILFFPTEYKSKPRKEIHGQTVADDKRFSSIFDDDGNYDLQIKFTQAADDGIYQCQLVSTKFTSFVNVTLELQEAYAQILGHTDVRCINDKKPLRLSCVLHNTLEPPEYIFWYHDDRVINYDLGDGAHDRRGDKGSELIFPKPSEKHAGNYTCVPSNARQASVYIKWTKDIPSFCELPDPTSDGGKKSHSQEDHIVNMLVLISTFHLCR